MTHRVARNRQFLTDLFAGPFRGHAIILPAPRVSSEAPDDFILSDRPVECWLPDAVADYRQQCRYLAALDDDSVPTARCLHTNTGVFASAFGCQLHAYEEDTNACALPAVRSAREADALPEPTLDGPALSRVIALARLVRRELGPKAPINVPDMQSPLDIAALVWDKSSFYTAMLDAPGSVLHLIDKCRRLLERFLTAFLAEFGEINLCHCPSFWAPPSLGLSLSEDEIGAISPALFAEFCEPSLTALSERFGGIFLHCCAYADHQYPGLRRIPRLRGLNRHFSACDWPLTLDTFAGKSVLTVAWMSADEVERLLDLAPPGLRFLFNPDARDLDEAKRVHDRLRARCPRSAS